MKIGIFVINYNAVSFLIKTLERIPKEIYDIVEEIFVIDDCSSDNSYYAALGYKHENSIDKLTVHRNTVNHGYGGNQKIGYNYAIKKNFDIVILLHGDGQYAPEILPDLIQPLLEKKADMVLGSRMFNPKNALKGGMPYYKFFGNRILTKIQNWLSGLNLTEFHSGYRLYNMHALKEIPFNNFTNTWHFDTEIILEFYKRNFSIVERPIPTYYGDEICHVNGIPYAINCIVTSFKFWLNKKTK